MNILLNYERLLNMFTVQVFYAKCQYFSTRILLDQSLPSMNVRKKPEESIRYGQSPQTTLGTRRRQNKMMSNTHPTNKSGDEPRCSQRVSRSCLRHPPCYTYSQDVLDINNINKNWRLFQLYSWRAQIYKQLEKFRLATTDYYFDIFKPFTTISVE